MAHRYQVTRHYRPVFYQMRMSFMDFGSVAPAAVGYAWAMVI